MFGKYCIIESIIKRKHRMMNDGALIGMAMGNMMADQTFRNIIGFKLLQDDNKTNDGVGMALIMNDSNPFRDVGKFMVQPPTLGGLFHK